MIDRFSEAGKLLHDFDIFPDFSDLIDEISMSSYLGNQYTALRASTLPHFLIILHVLL